MSAHYSKAYSAYGASMGRPGRAIPLENELCKLHRVPLDSGGYDPGGAYWGTPSDLWRLQCADGDRFTRAPTRFRAFLKFHEDLRFEGFRGSFRVRP